jgi:hypothetical protein
LFRSESFSLPSKLYGFLDNFTKSPAFGFAQWSGFDERNAIADLTTIVFVMRPEFVPAADILFVQGMLDQPLDLNHNGFIHLIADNGPANFSFCSTCFHMRP